jgi:hypothetical protein
VKRSLAASVISASHVQLGCVETEKQEGRKHQVTASASLPMPRGNTGRSPQSVLGIPNLQAQDLLEVLPPDPESLTILASVPGASSAQRQRRSRQGESQHPHGAPGLHGNPAGRLVRQEKSTTENQCPRLLGSALLPPLGEEGSFLGRRLWFSVQKAKVLLCLSELT